MGNKAVTAQLNHASKLLFASKTGEAKTLLLQLPLQRAAITLHEIKRPFWVQFWVQLHPLMGVSKEEESVLPR